LTAEGRKSVEPMAAVMAPAIIDGADRFVAYVEELTSVIGASSFHRRDALPRVAPGGAGGEQMDDNELWLSLREALNYIATGSDQAHEAALKLVGDSGKSGSGNEKFESDVVEADLVTWGTSKPPEQARFSEPPAPYQIHLSLLGAATEAFKEGARRGIRCRGTHPVTRERVDIEFGDWPVLIVPVEAAFNDKGEVRKEENGVSIVFCEGVTVYWPDLVRQFPRPSTPAPPPVPTVPVPTEETAANGETAPASISTENAPASPVAVKKRTRQRTARPAVEAALRSLFGDAVPSEMPDAELLTAVANKIWTDTVQELYPDGLPQNLTEREVDAAVMEKLKAQKVGWPIKLDSLRRASGRRIDMPRRRNKPRQTP
jgi:hypothetical protein